LHYTVLDEAETVRRFCDPSFEVSAHYLVGKDGEITQLVEEDKRAWHAGESSWKGQTDINSRSIGIELVNNGEEPFPTEQIAALKILLKEIMARHAIARDSVLGHSDIAPTRKKDPGALFPWRELAQDGICLFPDGDKGII
jgi:N-acetylmuramoyl-L-alanine amidase